MWDEGAAHAKMAPDKGFWGPPSALNYGVSLTFVRRRSDQKLFCGTRSPYFAMVVSSFTYEYVHFMVIDRPISQLSRVRGW